MGDELPHNCAEIALLKICEVQFWLLQISKILCGKIILTVFIKHLQTEEPSAMLLSYLVFFLNDYTVNNSKEGNSELISSWDHMGRTNHCRNSTWYRPEFFLIVLCRCLLGLMFRDWQKGNVFFSFSFQHFYQWQCWGSSSWTPG